MRWFWTGRGGFFFSAAARLPVRSCPTIRRLAFGLPSPTDRLVGMVVASATLLPALESLSLTVDLRYHSTWGRGHADALGALCKVPDARVTLRNARFADPDALAHTRATVCCGGGVLTVVA